MTALIALLAIAVLALHVLAMAVGRRSLVSLPELGSPLSSPRLAPAASAKPSQESRARQGSVWVGAERG